MAITNFIPTVWSENLYQALDKQYIAVANCNREYEGDIREKGSVVKICGIGDISVSDYLKGSNMTAPEALSDTVRELHINQAKYFNFQIDDIDRTQATPQLMALAMKNAANALANAADRYIYNLYDQAGLCKNLTVAGGDEVINHLIDARTHLMEKNVSDPKDIIIEVSPAVASMIMKAKINLASDNTDTLENGCIGNVGGCKVFVSNNIVQEEDESGMIHNCIVRTKRAIAFAEQLSEIEAYRPELRFADAVKGLHLYGAKVVYPEEMVTLSLTVPTVA
ncbi:MAG: P22 coat protein - protein 5 domain protein [Clostridia bacterium]|nr:P22 coat protein - protein 5 domain protein [Clostridia bacterium]